MDARSSTEGQTAEGNKLPGLKIGVKIKHEVSPPLIVAQKGEKVSSSSIVSGGMSMMPKTARNLANTVVQSPLLLSPINASHNDPLSLASARRLKKRSGNFLDQESTGDVKQIFDMSKT